MSELIDRLKAKYPHHKILQDPDPACGCKGTGEKHTKSGRAVLCLCVCLSGDHRAEVTQAFGDAARKVAAELRAERSTSDAVGVKP